MFYEVWAETLGGTKVKVGAFRDETKAVARAKALPLEWLYRRAWVQAQAGQK